MKPCHAAMLALVGWYLMYPPLTPDNQVLTERPLAEWKSGASFDTAKDCEAARSHVSKDGEKLQDAAEAAHDAIGGNLARDMTWAQCVTSDDPRLKEK